MERQITPLESLEQTWLFQWVSTQENKYPELELLHHIPNGGKASKEQKQWIDKLNKAGNKAVIKEGWIEAAKEIINYLDMDITL